ncbi:MAG: hypothetical protein HY043_10820 [Verrucomicrobia bacterium]|nr:hypothetical protein [Verrucomicrobiota bacterium]
MLRSLVPAILLAMATPILTAADATAGDKTPAERREQIKKQRDEFKNLSPEEKAAKIKERKAKMETRLAQLQKKKADGSITAQEQKQLDRLEAWKKNPDQAGPRPPRARKPAGDKPAGNEKPQ